MHYNKYLLWSIIGLACLTPLLGQRRRQQGQSQYCITPDNYYGSCVALTFCPQVVNIFEEVDAQYAKQYLFSLQRSCGTRSVRGDPVVCCTRPQTSAPTSSPAIENPFLPNRRPTTTVTTFIQPERQTTTTTTTEQPTTPPPPPPPPTSTTETPKTSAPVLDNRGTYCRGPDTKEGTCAALENCPALLAQLQSRPTDDTLRNYLRASNRVCGSVGSMVCCPSVQGASTLQPINNNNNNNNNDNNNVASHFPSVDEGCGVTTNSFKKIVGGKVSKKGAWPWAALLGYVDGVSSTTAFRCGGSLVTSRHVVTAAHCIVRGLSVVRLGEHDLATDSETKHVDVPISRTAVHPKYNRNIGHSDIAVVYLQKNVQFNALIAPVCMPTSSAQRSKSYVNYMPFVVGWGKTMEGGFSSEVLQELQIPVLENSVCEESYAKVKRFFAVNQFDSAVLCAGVLSGGKDTCQGDSGGPLTFPEPYGNNVRFFLIGVVSYGVGCARPEIPGVYSSVQYHMDWLSQKIAEAP